ncbi:MAG: sugar-binding domain-containing protein [Lachnospiraceae bacterium]|nr:sugar-binding domain-containing protein [Lachnospiraceae bacterium]
MNTNKLIQMLRIARQYYEYHLDQKEIAAKEGISVSTVSRMIKKAFDSGYVKISIDYPFLSNEELSKELQKAYGIQKVFLTPVIVPEPNAILTDTCKAAAAALPSYIKSNSVIGTAWGNTMKALAACIKDIDAKDTKIVQLNGRCANFAMPSGADDMVETLVKRARGEGYIIPAPVVVDTAQTASMLKEDSAVKHALELARNCDTAVFSVGPITEDSIMYRSGYLNDGVFEQLKKDGAVGDIASNYYNIEGQAADQELASRRIGINLEELKEIPLKFCVASGKNKAASLHGALKGGYIDVLYADEELGKELFQFL